MQGMGGGGGRMASKSMEDEAWGMLNDWGSSVSAIAKSTAASANSAVASADLGSLQVSGMQQWYSPPFAPLFLPGYLRLSLACLGGMGCTGQSRRTRAQGG